MRSGLPMLALALASCSSLVPPAKFVDPEASESDATSAEPSASPSSSTAVEVIGHDPEQAWVRPRFDTVDGPIVAGTAFVCEPGPGEPPLLLTAQHLFGPAGGLPRDYEWSEMGTSVRGAEGRDDEGTVVLKTGPPLVITDAKGMSDEGVGNDLAAFSLLGPARIHALPLAVRAPAVSEAVWLIGPVESDDSLRHRATVVEFGDDYLIYAYDEPIELRATSGAAVVNTDGEVVAVNLGGGDEGGVTIGVGNPASSVRRHLDAAQR